MKYTDKELSMILSYDYFTFYQCLTCIIDYVRGTEKCDKQGGWYAADGYEWTPEKMLKALANE